MPKSRSSINDPVMTYSPMGLQATRSMVGWDKCAKTRGAVVNLYTDSQSKWFLKTAHDNDKYFFAPMNDSLVWIIFYTVYPQHAGQSLFSDIQKLGWKEVKMDYFDRFSASLAHLDPHGARQFITTYGQVSVYIFPIVINLPEWMQFNAGVLDNPEWLRCANLKWPLPYALYTATPVYQLLSHPVLMVGYDYILRMDFDVHFKRLAPFHMMDWMSDRKCVAMHALLEYGGAPNGCQHDAPHIFERYAYSQNKTVASLHEFWWGDETFHFYGNFQAFHTRWFQSRENIALASWLWNDQVWAPYFKTRSTDQGSIIRMLGLYYNLSFDDLQGNKGASPICDLTEWRRPSKDKTNVIFTHQE